MSAPAPLRSAPLPPTGGEPGVAPVVGEAGAPPAVGVSFSNASLYVGDLQPDVIESNLYELFSSVGSVASIRICRDNVTRRSLGYGYVNFHNPEDASRAIEILNYEKIRGRPCRIMWSQRDPTLRKTGVGNVFVKNIDAAIDNQTLNDTFSKFGNILSCKVATTADGTSKGYGFVHFDSDEAAANAIKNANGTLLLNKVIVVEKYIRKNERRTVTDWTNLYFKNYPVEWSESQVRELFGKYGNVTSLVISPDGFGFVNYDSHTAAEAAVNNLHGLKVGVDMVKTEVQGPDGVPTGEVTEVPRDKLLYVQKHQKKNERESYKAEQAKAEQAKKIEKYAGRNLYVRNFDDTIDEDRLRAEFKEFGAISSCIIMRSPEGVSKGYGFVCFSSSEEATKAVTKLNGKMLDRKPLYVALAQRKDDRKVLLEQQRRQNQMRGGIIGGIPPYNALPLGGYPGGFVPRGGFPPQQFMNQQYFPAGAGGGRPGYPPNSYGPRGGAAGRGRGGAGGRGGRGGRGGYGGGGGYPGPMGRPGAMPPAPVPVAVGAPIPPAAGPRNVAGLTTQALANASEEQRINMIGERLFPLVANLYPEHASKITGMLLEMETSDLLHLLESHAALQEKVEEALGVLLQHQQSLGGDRA